MGVIIGVRYELMYYDEVHDHLASPNAICPSMPRHWGNLPTNKYIDNKFNLFCRYRQPTNAWGSSLTRLTQVVRHFRTVTIRCL